MVVVAAVEQVAGGWDIGTATELAALTGSLGWGATLQVVNLEQVPLDELVFDGSSLLGRRAIDQTFVTGSKGAEVGLLVVQQLLLETFR